MSYPPHPPSPCHRRLKSSSHSGFSARWRPHLSLRVRGTGAWQSMHSDGRNDDGMDCRSRQASFAMTIRGGVGDPSLVTFRTWTLGEGEGRQRRNAGKVSITFEPMATRIEGDTGIPACCLGFAGSWPAGSRLPVSEDRQECLFHLSGFIRSLRAICGWLGRFPIFQFPAFSIFRHHFLRLRRQIRP